MTPSKSTQILIKSLLKMRKDLEYTNAIVNLVMGILIFALNTPSISIRL
jgi:hypothetical protein